MTQQKLLRKGKNIPIDTSLVYSPMSSGLNKEETLSVQNISLLDNISEENQLSGKREHNPRVCVLNMRGEALMPTKPAKARHLLDEGKAKVVKRKPFVIQMTIATGETKQEVKLGIDSGYSKIGFSVITKRKELMSGEVKLRKDISKKLEQRKQYRRTRRSRKWYREPRFNNRKKEGLPPSLQHKVDTHLRLVNNLKKWFPIVEINIEIAKFDMQKMRNPEIEGVEYQQGELQGYNVKNYLLKKFDYECVYCSKKDVPLEVEHIIPKSRGGTNRVDNLTISCHNCNRNKDKQTAEEFGYPEIQEKAKKTLKQTAFMNVVRKRIANKIGSETTYGYITKKKRLKQGLSKTHSNDAFVIAGGNEQGCSQIRCKSYKVTQTRRNNRKLQLNRKGYGRSIRKKRYKFQPNDLVKYGKKEYRVKGVFNYGKWVRFEDGTNANIKDVRLIKYGNGLQF